jgi:hypothetical protein
MTEICPDATAAVYVIDGYPPAVYRHTTITRTADGFHRIAVPGISRPKLFHPSNVFQSRTAARRELVRRRGGAR